MRWHIILRETVTYEVTFEGGTQEEAIRSARQYHQVGFLTPTEGDNTVTVDYVAPETEGAEAVQQ